MKSETLLIRFLNISNNLANFSFLFLREFLIGIFIKSLNKSSYVLFFRFA